MTKLIRLLSILAITLSISCTSESGKKTEISGDISIDGSSTVYPLTEAVAEEFRVDHSKVQVTIGVSGTGGGFQKFARAETDISNASRSIKESESELCEQNGVDYIGITVAYDGLAVLANPENNWLDSITAAELKMIWEPDAQGKVLRWNQIRPEWPNEEIHLYGPGIASGTYDYFTEAIVGKSGSSRGDFTASEDDNVLVQGIAGDKFGLGFFGLAYFEENKEMLKLIAVDGGNGAVYPELKTVREGTYEPLSRPMFIYVNSVAAKKAHVQSFVEFYIENASELTQEIGYIPLPDSVYDKQLELFEDFIKTL